MLKKIKIQVDGLHCQSCKILLETELDVLAGVNKVEVNHKTGECVLEFDDRKISLDKIIEKIESFDYNVVGKKEKPSEESGISNIIKGFSIPIILGLIILVLFLFKNYGGFEILARLNEPNIGYGLIFIIGVLASFHCIGMCSGLVVAYSADCELKKQGLLWPHIQYNLGRLISYSFIGGILGGIGSFFGINPNFGGAIMIFAGVFMFLMALSLYTNFKWLDKLKLKTPEFIARFMYNQKHSKKPKGPFIIGLANGFMPCGPLQAMQLYALGTGSLVAGAFSMGAYALGTIPLMFGFGAVVSIISKKYLAKMMKISAVVVGILAIIMLNRGLVNFGWGFIGIASDSVEYAVDSDEFQEVKMDLSFGGYDPNIIYVKKDVPVRWIINVRQMSGCTDEIIMEEYNIRKKLQYGENIIEFIPEKEGEVLFSCWMKMVWGKFVVTNDGGVKGDFETIDLPEGGSCGGDGGGCSCGK